MSGPAPRRAIASSRWRARIAAPAIVVAGLVATGLTLAAIPSPTEATGAGSSAATTAAGAGPIDTTLARNTRTDVLDLTLAKRDARTNRSTARPALHAAKKKARKPAAGSRPESVGIRYATVALNVRVKADPGAPLLTVLEAGSKVSITGTTDGPWRQIVRDGKGVWVKKQYLATKKPAPKASGAVSGAACQGGSGMEQGLTPDAITVHRALCARYPQITAYGGVRQGDGGEHGSGRAVDAMISDSTVGWQIAKWVRANAGRLGVSQVIYSQHIWTVQRSSEGWRSMPDRGSATANHYDHVHVTVYGNSAN